MSNLHPTAVLIADIEEAIRLAPFDMFAPVSFSNMDGDEGDEDNENDEGNEANEGNEGDEGP